MIETIAQFPIGFIVALSGVLLPGPLLAFVVVKTISGGARIGTSAAVGHILVELGIVSLVCLGLGFVLRSQAFQVGVGALGGGLLLILGVLNLVQVWRIREFKPEIAGVRHHAIIGGVLFSTVLNPSVILWWATIGLAMLTEAFLTAAAIGAALWLTGHFLADLGWYSFVSYSITKGKWLMGSRGYKGLLIACGCVLLLFGIYFIIKFWSILID
ncbi:MAG: LysE family transporter [Candidatus Hodarchaeaceae archaeon]|nr:LysE family transporter [Candidatus Hodarchaeaceae archaeon]